MTIAFRRTTLRPWLRPAALVLTILLGFTGCQSWRVATVPTAQVVAEEAPDQVRIVRGSDSSEVVLHQPMIVGDSLRGLPTALTIRPLMIPLSDITEVAVRRFDLGKTLLRSFLVIGGVVLYELLQGLNQGGFAGN